ncbi:MAG: GFA family protein [Gammaproteobacteria bacterium]|nr:GFA family protein [Gammaproteobacteria bacterium]NNC96623.1 GFA family protein [Gammaproteobacteria bacterium]NNM14945.1 GFA family protein [Gammaproteobacteria bacterium]
MLRGACHCGKIKFEYLIVPEYLNDCNCSICRRLGALWAYADSSQIEIHCDQTDLINYVWGDKSLAFCSCKYCGCTTHWKNLDPEKFTRMAVNARMMDPMAIKEIPVRQFDGADTFNFLD